MWFRERITKRVFFIDIHGSKQLTTFSIHFPSANMVIRFAEPSFSVGANVGGNAIITHGIFSFSFQCSCDATRIGVSWAITWYCIPDEWKPWISHRDRASCHSNVIFHSSHQPTAFFTKTIGNAFKQMIRQLYIKLIVIFSWEISPSFAILHFSHVAYHWISIELVAGFFLFLSVLFRLLFSKCLPQNQLLWKYSRFASIWLDTAATRNIAK